jgi:hypothetical protein
MKAYSFSESPGVLAFMASFGMSMYLSSPCAQTLTVRKKRISPSVFGSAPRNLKPS